MGIMESGRNGRFHGLEDYSKLKSCLSDSRREVELGGWEEVLRCWEMKFWRRCNYQ